MPSERQRRSTARWLVALTLASAASGCADLKRGDVWHVQPDVGAGDDGAATSYDDDIHPLLVAGCARCHDPDASAGATDFLITGDPELDYDNTRALVEPGSPATSRLLTKAAGGDHDGGVIYREDAPEYAQIERWIEDGAPR